MDSSVVSRDIRLEFLLGVLALGVFLFFKMWAGRAVFEKVRNYHSEFRAAQRRAKSYDEKMADRFGFDYLFPNHLASMAGSEKAVFLMPPRVYVQRFVKTTANCLLNPVYMYAMNSTVKVVSVESRSVNDVNCTVLIDSTGNCYPFRITNLMELDAVITLFKSGRTFVLNGSNK